MANIIYGNWRLGEIEQRAYLDHSLVQCMVGRQDCLTQHAWPHQISKYRSTNMCGPNVERPRFYWGWGLTVRSGFMHIGFSLHTPFLSIKPTCGHALVLGEGLARSDGSGRELLFHHTEEQNTPPKAPAKNPQVF